MSDSLTHEFLRDPCHQHDQQASEKAAVTYIFCPLVDYQCTAGSKGAAVMQTKATGHTVSSLNSGVFSLSTQSAFTNTGKRTGRSEELTEFQCSS